MGFLKQLFDFLINSSVLVALAVCSLSWITILNFDLDVDRNLLWFTFFATITGYNFVKYFGLAKFHHRQLASWLKQIQIFSFFCFIALCYFTFQLEFRTLLYLGGLGVITFLYAIPFLPKTLLLDSSKNLRAISGIKIYVIALVWAGVTVIIPLVNAEYAIDQDVILTAIQRYFYVIVATLPFEIRDMQFDSIKLATIPQRIGVKRTKLIGAILLIPFLSIELLMDVTSNRKLLILFVIAIILLWCLLFSKIKQQKYFSSFWVEVIPILWWLLTIF